MFSLLLIASLYFSWEDLREKEISALVFYAVFVAFAGLNWSNIYRSIPFLLLAFLAWRFTIGVGEGDFCLLAMYALVYDWEECLLILFLAAFSGLIFSLLYRIVTGIYMKTLPFIPFLTIALFLYDSFVKSNHNILTSVSIIYILVQEIIYT